MKSFNRSTEQYWRQRTADAERIAHDVLALLLLCRFAGVDAELIKRQQRNLHRVRDAITNGRRMIAAYDREKAR